MTRNSEVEQPVSPAFGSSVGTAGFSLPIGRRKAAVPAKPPAPPL